MPRPHPRVSTPTARRLAAALFVCCLAGCSQGTTGSSPAASTTPGSTTSGSTTPGSTNPGSTAAAGTSPSASRTPLDAGLGPMPSYLPGKGATSLAQGSVDDPALSYSGAPVLVVTPAGTVRIDVEGPSYPPGTPVGATQVACTFTVTFSRASATLPLAAGHFDVYDHLGTVHPVGLARKLPASIAPGQRVTVRVTATVPSGEGLLRWYPQGRVAAAGWDYVAETD